MRLSWTADGRLPADEVELQPASCQRGHGRRSAWYNWRVVGGSDAHTSIKAIPADTARAADIEQEKLVAEQLPPTGRQKQRDVADAEQQAQLSGAEAPEGKVGTSRWCRVVKIDLDGEQEVGDQQAERYVWAHVGWRAPGPP